MKPIIRWFRCTFGHQKHHVEYSDYAHHSDFCFRCLKCGREWRI